MQDFPKEDPEPVPASSSSGQDTPINTKFEGKDESLATESPAEAPQILDNGDPKNNLSALSRSETRAAEHWPPMGDDKPYPPPLPDREPYRVGWDSPDDPLHPHNFPMHKKIIFGFCGAYYALTVTMSSALFSQASPVIMELYHVGYTTATLGTSLFVLGFASGPIIFGPLSELYGRKIMMLISNFGFIAFSIGVATAENLQTIMLCRFFAGFVGSAPMVLAPALSADVFTVQHRGRAMAAFTIVLFGGPMLAPIIGAFTVKNPNMGWKWTEYLSSILGASCLILNIFVLEESHQPTILARKAETLRRKTGNWGIYAPLDETKLGIQEIVQQNLTRPVYMLFTEPILLLVSLYNAFIYGMLYLFLTVIPMIFSLKYHFISGVAELPYLAMFIGILLGTSSMFFFERRYQSVRMKNGGIPVPEERLPPMMVGSFFFTIGLFWLGWTGQYAEHVHWIVPVIGIAFVGFGLILVFLPCLTYIVDCYLFINASALAGNTFVRCSFGAAFPLFAKQMFDRLGINWGGSLVGFLSLAMIPVPFFFYKYGKHFRKKSKMAFSS